MTGWWRRRSLRARLTVLATAALALGLAVGTAGLAVLFAQGRNADLDRQLLDEAATLRELVVTDQLTQPLPVAPGSPVLAQVIDSAGTVLASTAAAGRILPLVPAQLLDRLAPAGVTTVEDTGFGAGALRVDVQTADLTDTPVRIVVASPVREVTSTLDALRRVLFIVVPLTVLAAGLAAWVAIGSALAPVDELRSAAERIGEPGRRGQPRPTLPVPPTDDEIARLAATLNLMLQRLDVAAVQQRNFAADAAHELRSPLSALITGLEVALAGRDQTRWPQVGAAALVDARRLARVVDDLLLLARTDGDRPLRQERVDIAALVAGFADGAEDQLTAEATTGDPGRVVVEVHVPPQPVVVLGDQEALERAVRNLVDNARTYARTGVQLRVELSGELSGDNPGTVDIVVTDDGPGIPAEEMDRVFDRFHRLDASRSRHAGGSGLGLPIVRGIARSHGGEAEVGRVPSGGTVARLRLPLEKPSPPDDTL